MSPMCPISADILLLRLSAKRGEQNRDCVNRLASHRADASGKLFSIIEKTKRSPDAVVTYPASDATQRAGLGAYVTFSRSAAHATP